MQHEACKLLCHVITLISANHVCPSGMWECNNNRCIFERWRCDGEADCYGGEDESAKECSRSSCPDVRLTAQHTSHLKTVKYFLCCCVVVTSQHNMTMCVGSTRCIDNSWICDREDDCGDNSDEQGCSELHTVLPL